MTIKPILFNTEEVRATLDGRKTVTRRVVKGDIALTPGATHEVEFSPVSRKVRGHKISTVKYLTMESFTAREAPYRPGDILYVRETWRLVDFDCIDTDWSASVQYKADMAMGERWHDLSPDERIGWRPSIHMPREAARIFLRVTGVRVERVFDSFFKPGAAIFDLRAEGITLPEVCADCIDAYGWPCCNDEDCEGGSECCNLDGVRDDFATLWNNTIKPTDRGRYSWAANPWVWVIEFERCDAPPQRGVQSATGQSPALGAEQKPEEAKHG